MSINRRQPLRAVLGLGLASVVGRAARAQRPFRITLLPDFGVEFDPAILAAFIEALAQAGRIQGRDYVIHHTGVAYGRDFEAAVARAVESRPDLIFGFNTGYMLAAQRLAPRIPIVMWASGFPVEAGLVDSLVRPGRNATGVSGYADTGLFAKYMEILRDARPSIRRIGYLSSYVPPISPPAEMAQSYQEVRAAAHALRLDLHVLEIAHPDQVDEALVQVERRRLEALVLTSGALWVARQRIIDFTVRKRIITLSDYQWTSVDPAPVFSYSAADRALVRQAADYVDRILWGGARPADLPVQRPVRYEFVVNLKTARAIGLAVPQALLLRADRVVR